MGCFAILSFVTDFLQDLSVQYPKCQLDPFDGAKPRLLRRDKEAPLRVNPEQAQAFRPESRRVDFWVL